VLRPRTTYADRGDDAAPCGLRRAERADGGAGGVIGSTVHSVSSGGVECPSYGPGALCPQCYDLVLGEGAAWGGGVASGGRSRSPSAPGRPPPHGYGRAFARAVALLVRAARRQASAAARPGRASKHDTYEVSRVRLGGSRAARRCIRASRTLGMSSGRGAAGTSGGDLRAMGLTGRWRGRSTRRAGRRCGIARIGASTR
jgi:hypothetical protein